MLLAGAAALGAVFAPAPAHAQGLPPVGGYALDQLEPAAAGDNFFGIYSPSVVGHLEFRGYAMLDYASRPLPFLANNGKQTAVVDHQLFLRGDVSLALFDRFLFNVNVPGAVLQDGQQPPTAGVDFHSPKGPDFGDLRLTGRLRLVGDNGRPFQLGVQGDFFVPTAPAASYTGDGGFRGGAYLLAGGQFTLGIPFVWSAQGGGVFRTSGNPHSITYGIGVASLLFQERLQVGVEAFGSAWLGERPPLSTDAAKGPDAGHAHLEASLGAKFRVVGGLQIGAAIGRSFIFTTGSPDLRTIGFVAWAPAADKKSTTTQPTNDGPDKAGDRANGKVAQAAKDSDGDGLNDDVDACPNAPGGLSGDPSKDGCPASDKDSDGVEDVEDACPSVAGTRRSEAAKNGCPDDADGDGVYDASDACPSTKGTASADSKKNGCPVDSDGDGVVDSEDACPAQAGPASTASKWSGCPEDPDGDGIKSADDACPFDKGAASKDKDANGCPDHIRVTDNAILLRHPIEFISYGKGRHQTINPPSDAVLRQVRDAIQAHPEILKIEVQGHTDDAGTEEFNKTLSQERAEAVRSWLVTAGVSADKLVAKGYGMDKPIADNRIRTGRRKNRRVELVVLEKRK